MKYIIRTFFAGLLVCSCTVGIAQTPVKPTTGEDLIAFLNQTILWYRQLTVQQQLATEPSDILFLNDNRQLADQIVRLSFDYARSEAQELARTNPAAAATNNGGQPSRYQNLLNLAANADQQLKQAQADLEAQKRELETATGRRRQTLESSIAETQSEVELRQARRDALRSLINFVIGANVGGTSAGSLPSQIEEL